MSPGIKEGHEFKNQIGNAFFLDVKSLVWSLPTAPTVRFPKVWAVGEPDLRMGGLRPGTDIAALTSSGVLLQTIARRFMAMGPGVPTVKDPQGPGLGLLAHDGWRRDSYHPIFPRGRGPGTQGLWQSHPAGLGHTTPQASLLLWWGSRAGGRPAAFLRRACEHDLRDLSFRGRKRSRRVGLAIKPTVWAVLFELGFAEPLGSGEVP